MSSEPFSDDTHTLTEVAAIVLRNWRDELVALWRDMLRGETPETLVRLSVRGGEVVAFLDTDDRAIELGRYGRTAVEADALNDRLEREELLRRGRADVILQFDDSAVLRAQLRLPKVSQAATRGALGFELARLSPVPPNELYYDHSIAAAAGNKIEVAARAIRRKPVDEAQAFARSAGLSVGAIRLGDDAREADWRHFPLDRLALVRMAWRRWGSLLFGALALLLLVALLFASWARSAAADATLDARIDDAGTRAAIVERIAHKTQDTRRVIADLARQKSLTGLVATLGALTDALPDGTWLTEIQFDNGKLHITGFSHAASDLIARLDRSGAFAATQFNAPVVRNDADGTERFDLSSIVRSAP